MATGVKSDELAAENKKEEEESMEDDDDDDDEDIYEVEKVVGMEQRKGKTLYKVRWAGYSPSWDTWEPYDNLLSCIDMIDEYVNQHKKQEKEKSGPKSAVFNQEIFSQEESSDNDADDSDKRSMSGSTSSKGSRKKKPTYFYVTSEDDAADTLKDKFWRDLEQGKVNVFGNDMYSKVKGQGRVSRPSGSGPSEAGSTHSSPSIEHPAPKKRRKSSEISSSTKSGKSKKEHSQAASKASKKRPSVNSQEDLSSDDSEAQFASSAKGNKKGKSRNRGKGKAAVKGDRDKATKKEKVHVNEGGSCDATDLKTITAEEKSETLEVSSTQGQDIPTVVAVKVEPEFQTVSSNPLPSEEAGQKEANTLVQPEDKNEQELGPPDLPEPHTRAELASPQSPDAVVHDDAPVLEPIRKPDVVAGSAGASACGPKEGCTAPPGGDLGNNFGSPAMDQKEWFSKDPKLLCCRVLVKHVSWPSPSAKVSAQSHDEPSDKDEIPSEKIGLEDKKLDNITVLTESPASPDEPSGLEPAGDKDADCDKHAGQPNTNGEISSCDISASKVASDSVEVKSKDDNKLVIVNTNSDRANNQLELDDGLKDGSSEKANPLICPEPSLDSQNDPVEVSQIEEISQSDTSVPHSGIDKDIGLVGEEDKGNDKEVHSSHHQLPGNTSMEADSGNDMSFTGPACEDADVINYPDPYSVESDGEQIQTSASPRESTENISDYNSNEAKPFETLEVNSSQNTSAFKNTSTFIHVREEDPFLQSRKGRDGITTSSPGAPRPPHPSSVPVKSSMSLGDDAAFDFEFDIDPAPWDARGPGRPVVDYLELSNSELKQAVRENEYDRVRKALNSRKNYDLEQSDVTGVTLAMVAAQNGYDDVLELLVINGANVNARQKNGATALMHACEQGHRCTVELLLMMGAYVNIQQLNGETALMKAVKRGNHHIVRLLLYYGANFAAQSNHNSALNLAKQLKNTVVMDVLSNHISQITADFENQVNITVNNTAQIQCALFPLQCFALCESDKFQVFFNHELQPTRPGVGMLLFIAHSRITSSEIKCRFYGPCAVSSVVLNGVGLQPLTEESNFVMSFSPLHNGKNELEIHTVKAATSRAKLVVCAYTAQLQVPIDST